MNTDESNQSDVSFAYLRPDNIEELGGGIKAVSQLDDGSWSGFELTFLDHNKRRQWEVTDHAVSNQDVNYLKEILLTMTPEFRAFILESARLLCEAGDSKTEQRRSEYPDMRKLFD